MSEPKNPFRAPVLPAAQAKTPITRQGLLQPKTIAGQQQQQQRPAVNQPARQPVAPPVYRPQQPAPKAVQPKMHIAAPAMQSRPVAATSSGVIQANVVGGPKTLQARLAVLQSPAAHLPNPHATAAAARPGPPKPTAQPQNRMVKAPAVQAKGGRPGVEAFKVPLQPKSGGLPLPDQVRAKMEAAFSTDFSDVRVHIGREASSIGAIAYTWGTNIHFAPGQYNPHSLQGQKLLGHELWHVVQQKAGRVRNPLGGVAVVQDHALEAEADRMGVKAALTTLPRNSDK
jgi:hypothetical protein